MKKIIINEMILLKKITKKYIHSDDIIEIRISEYHRIPVEFIAFSVTHCLNSHRCCLSCIPPSVNLGFLQDLADVIATGNTKWWSGCMLE